MEAKPSVTRKRMPLDPLPSGSFVFRLVTIKNMFIPPEAEFPVGEAFRPTDADKAEATQRGTPVLVSVWEHGVTTPDQGTAIRNADAQADERQPHDSRPYWLSTADIENSAPSSRLAVLHDPLPPTDGPGADGHAGIKGLDRLRGASHPCGCWVLKRVEGVPEPSVMAGRHFPKDYDREAIEELIDQIRELE